MRMRSGCLVGGLVHQLFEVALQRGVLIGSA